MNTPSLIHLISGSFLEGSEYGILTLRKVHKYCPGLVEGNIIKWALAAVVSEHVRRDLVRLFVKPHFSPSDTFSLETIIDSALREERGSKENQRPHSLSEGISIILDIRTLPMRSL